MGLHYAQTPSRTYKRHIPSCSNLTSVFPKLPTPHQWDAIHPQMTNRAKGNSLGHPQGPKLTFSGSRQLVTEIYFFSRHME